MVAKSGEYSWCRRNLYLNPWNFAMTTTLVCKRALSWVALSVMNRYQKTFRLGYYISKYYFEGKHVFFYGRLLAKATPNLRKFFPYPNELLNILLSFIWDAHCLRNLTHFLSLIVITISCIFLSIICEVVTSVERTNIKNVHTVMFEFSCPIIL